MTWYLKAATQRHCLAPLHLRGIYENDHQVKDLQKAVNWYHYAADNKVWWGKYNLQRLNEQGYYAEEDDKEGMLLTYI
jgi:TPR repeat protein